MLPSELLISWYQGESIIPKRLKLDAYHLDLANNTIDCFIENVGKTQGELNEILLQLEGDHPDFRVRRGLAHILRSETFSRVEIVSPIAPQILRTRLYELAANYPPSIANSALIINKLADELSQELKQEILPEKILHCLYADLWDNRILTNFEAISAESLIHRYNLSQVQGIFYKASEIVIHAYRNVPGQYKLLFRYLKLFQLMSYVEGDAEHGFTITIDGPTSLFKASTRYGLAIAKLIPALLYITKWQLTATLQIKNTYDQKHRIGRFQLNSSCGLISHYPVGKTYDSMLEEAFVKRWEKTKTDWQLEREVDLIPIPGSVMIPDFRLVHPDGRFYLLEIIGYWRSSYLKKKFYQIKQSGCDYLILAISERLNLSASDINIDEVSLPIVWFKDKLSPQSILNIINA